MNRPVILGVPADPLTYAELFQTLETWVAGEALQQICTINPEFIMIAQQNPEFYEVLQKSALNVIDGWGAVWALRWRGIPVPGRVTGSDGVPFLVEQAAKKGWKLFFLGAGEGIAPLAAEIFRQKHPGVQIVGTYGGSPQPAEAKKIIQLINASGADILLVAYGAPQQDIWIYRHREQLKVKVAMGVGGTFDFVTGYVPRAPLWMRNWGLEWLFRLYLQPWRWRRMLRLPVFMVKALLFKDRPPSPIMSHKDVK